MFLSQQTLIINSSSSGNLHDFVRSLRKFIEEKLPKSLLLKQDKTFPSMHQQQ